MILKIYNFFISLLKHPEIIFVFIALIFGNIFLFLTPAFDVPDETAHVYKSCEVASGIFYSKNPVEITVYEKKIETIIPQRPANEFHFSSRNSAIMYVPSALGIKAASFFTKDAKTIFNFGRIFNLLSYILLCFLAIRITPVFKYPLMFIALLPMSLFLAMSYSADSFNNGFAFLYFAFLFKLIFSKEQTSKKDFTILTLLAIIGAFCKGLIYPLVLFIFLPKFTKQFKFNKWFYIFSIMILTILISAIWVKINPTNTNPNYQVINDSNYIFAYPQTVFNKIVLTTIQNFEYYIKEIIGFLGTLNIPLHTDCYNLAIFSFILLLFVFNEDKITLKQRLISLLCFVIGYITAQYIQLIYWSIPTKETIDGFQGRYMLSFMPFLFIAFSSSKALVREKFKYAFAVFFIIAITTILLIAVKIQYYYYCNQYLLS